MEEEKRQEVHKKIDESWKESVDHERHSPATHKTPTGERDISPPADFKMLISGMGAQALLALGDLYENGNQTSGQTKEIDLRQAQYIIDMLSMLKEKTKGNLATEEEEMLEGLLHDLRMRYINRAKSGETS